MVTPTINKTTSNHPENSGRPFRGKRKRNLKRGVEECGKFLLSPNGKKALKSWIKGRKGDGREGLLNYKDTLLKKMQALGELLGEAQKQMYPLRILALNGTSRS